MSDEEIFEEGMAEISRLEALVDKINRLKDRLSDSSRPEDRESYRVSYNHYAQMSDSIASM